MAVLPSAEDVGPSPDTTPRHVGIGRWNPSVISDAASSFGRGLENLGNSVVDVVAQQQDQANEIEVAQARGTIGAATVSAHAALPTITDPSQLPNVQQGVTDVTQDALSRVTNPRSRALLAAGLMEQQARLKAAVSARGVDINNDQQVATYEQNKNTNIGAAAVIDDDQASQHSLDSVNQNIDGLVKGGVITATQGQKYRESAVEDYVISRKKYLEDQAKRTGDTSRLEAFVAANAMPGAGGVGGGATSGPAPGANGYGTKNIAYLRPVDQPSPGGTSPQSLYQHLISSGATPNEALVITGAAANESNINPNATHDPDATGTPQGYGLFGHKFERLDMRGKNAFQQADAALQELRTRPESAAVNAARTPEELADAEMRYEAPRGYSADNPRGGDNYTGRLNTIRYFASRLAGGTSAGAAPSTAIPSAPKPDASNSYFIGDSISDGLRGAAKAPGDTVTGRSPEHVLDAIDDADPADLQGKTIYLSTGASNAPDAITMVHAQLAALKEKGVDMANVRVIGVGDRKDFIEHKVNDQLAAIAKGEGAVFTGPLDPSNLAKDRVHAADYGKALTQVAGLNDMNAGGPKAAQGIDPSGYPIVPAKSEWPVGTSHVALKPDGTFDYVADDGGRSPVPGIRPTGTPDAALPAHPTGSIIDFLPPQKRAELVLDVHNTIDQINLAKERAANQRDTQTSAAIKNAEQMMIQGQTVSPESRAAIRAQAMASADPTMSEQWARFDAATYALDQMKGMSPTTMHAFVDDLQGKYSQMAATASPGDAQFSLLGAQLQAATHYEKVFQTEIAKDALGRALKENVLPNGITPINPDDPNVMSAIQKRVADAEYVKGFYKLSSAPYLLPQERVALRALSAAGGQKMVNFAANVVAGAGESAGPFFKQLGADADSFVSAGQLALKGASADILSDIAEYTGAASDPVARKDIPRFNENMMTKKFLVEDPLKDAAIGLGMEASGRLRRTANILAGADAMHDGLDPATTTDTTKFGQQFFDRAYNRALGAYWDAKGDRFGGLADYGGGWRSGPHEQKVIVPDNLKAADFGTVIDSLTDADIGRMPVPPYSANGKPMSAAMLKNAHLEPIPDKADGIFRGLYGAYMGDPSDPGSRPILDANGKKWTLDMQQLEPIFRARFPDSYLDRAPVRPDVRSRSTPEPYARVPGMIPASVTSADAGTSDAPTIPQEE